jgi:hypothetical protein
VIFSIERLEDVALIYETIQLAYSVLLEPEIPEEQLRVMFSMVMLLREPVEIGGKIER